VKNQIIPTTEPFFFSGGRTGCLLIHGFTGTPKEMRWMGEYLNKQGLTCSGIRLAGHATIPEDMIRSRWTDWTASVEDGYNMLRAVTDHIYLIGLSMGGILSLLMSTRLEVNGVVAMSTPYSVPGDHYPAWFINLYSKFVPFAKKSSEVPGSSWFDKKAYADHISYPQNPIRSVSELKILVGEMQAALSEIQKPVHLIHSKDDTYVSLQNMEQIYDGLVNTSAKTKLIIAGSGHVITRDAARLRVFESTLEFIHKVEGRLES
jgi:carboxylesterase